MESGAVTSSAQRAELPPAVRGLAAELLPATPELADGLTEHLVTTIPELRDADDELREELRASTEGNIGQVLRLLKTGVPADATAVPVEAAEFVRGLVRRGIELPALLRAYRLGHGWFWDRWSQSLDARITDPSELTAAREQSSAFMFTYIDRISDVLVGEYGSERDRVVRSAEQLRAETVRSILAGETVDEEVASGRLGYELRRHHVALRISSSGSEARGLERAAAEAVDALGQTNPLIVRSGVASLDVWCGSHAPADTDRIDGYRPPESIRVAVGAAGHGVAGFRNSHQQAVHAAHVATLAGPVSGPVTRYARVELVSLLAGDLPRARAFVTSRLGALASSQESVQRLRETLLAYIAASGSSSKVANDLSIHQNTVSYRVRKAEELLGRPITEDPIELGCALMLAAVIGPAVIAEEPATAR